MGESGPEPEPGPSRGRRSAGARPPRVRRAGRALLGRACGLRDGGREGREGGGGGRHRPARLQRPAGRAAGALPRHAAAGLALPLGGRRARLVQPGRGHVQPPGEHLCPRPCPYPRPRWGQPSPAVCSARRTACPCPHRCSGTPRTPPPPAWRSAWVRGGGRRGWGSPKSIVPGDTRAPRGLFFGVWGGVLLVLQLKEPGSASS